MACSSDCARPGAGFVEVQDRFAETGHGNVPTVQQPEAGLVQAEGFLEVPRLLGVEVLDGDPDVARDDVQLGPADGFLDLTSAGQRTPWPWPRPVRATLRATAGWRR